MMPAIAITVVPGELRTLPELLLDGAGWAEVSEALKSKPFSYERAVADFAMKKMLEGGEDAERAFQLWKVFGERIEGDKSWFVAQCYELCKTKPNEECLREEIDGLTEQLTLALCQNAELQEEIDWYKERAER